MNKTVLLGGVGAAVTVAALAINYAVTWREAAVEPVAIQPGDTAAAGGGDTVASAPTAPPPPPATDAVQSTGEQPRTAPPEVGAPSPSPTRAGGPSAPVIPEFDIVRINPSGDGVLGGRAAPGSLVTLYRDGRAVESITADDRGEWVMLPGVGVLNGAQEISLSAQLPGQPEVRSAQVVVLVPPTGGAAAPLALLMPREDSARGAGQAPAPTDAPPPAPAEAVVATAPTDEPSVEIAPADAVTAPDVLAAPEPAVEPAAEATATAPVAEASDAAPLEASDVSDGIAADAAAAAASVASAQPVTTEAAAAESAAAAVLELPSLAELQEIGAATGAQDIADTGAQDVVAAAGEDPAPAEALGGIVAEGRAAEALAAFEPPPLPETMPAVVVEAPPPMPVILETVPPLLAEAPPAAVEAPPSIEDEAPQRVTGAGVDSAASQPLVAAAVPDQPPARVSVEDNTQRTIAALPPAAEPPEDALNGRGMADTVASLDIATSREAGPGADEATAPPGDSAAAAAVRPDVTENITVTEIMIELKWSRPTVTDNLPAGEIIAAAPLTTVPQTPAPFRYGALPVLTDLPVDALWVETLATPPMHPAEPIGVVLAALPKAVVPAQDAVSVSFAALPPLEPPAPALAAAPQRAAGAPLGDLLVIEAAPATVRFAALEPAEPPAGWPERATAFDAPPLRSFDAAIAVMGDAGGRGAPVVGAAAGLDILDTGSYRSSNPAAAGSLASLDGASYQSTNAAAADVTSSAALSPLDSAGYQSSTPGTGGGIGAASGGAAASDPVDALIAEAQSALDAATRAQQAIDGSAAAQGAAGPAILPDGSLTGELPLLGLGGKRPGEAAAFGLTGGRPTLLASGTLAPDDFAERQAEEPLVVAAVADGEPAQTDAVQAATEEPAAAVEPAAVAPAAEAVEAPQDAGATATVDEATKAAADAAAPTPTPTLEAAAAPQEDVAAEAAGEAADAAADNPSAPDSAEVEVALATPEASEMQLDAPDLGGLDLGSFQRDERLTISDGAYAGLDSETLRGEGIRSGSVALQSVEYDERGEVIIGGTATPNAPLNIYVDNVHVGSAVAGAAGEWRVMPNQPLSEGLHYLRVDQVEKGGRVVARVESPFARVEPIAVTAGDSRVVVQPGNSLWRIARRTLGGGTRFTAIYEANRSQITDPDMIYPGQVFVVPATSSN